MYSDIDSIGTSEAIAAHPDKEMIRMILDSHPIREMIHGGCYIAGGFGRAILNKTSIEEYLGIELKSGTPPGDIDIFFDNPAQREHFTQLFRSKDRSWGRNALQRNLFVPRAGNFRIQLVDHDNLILPMSKQLDRFDFLNAAVALTEDAIIFPSRFYELESEKLLHVKRATSPFFGSRLLKYFKHRGIRGLTKESEQAVTEWIIRAMCNDFKLEASGNIMPESLIANVKALLSCKDITRADDLLLVLGKFDDFVQGEEYGEYKRVDFALSKLAERGLDVSIPTRN